MSHSLTYWATRPHVRGAGSGASAGPSCEHRTPVRPEKARLADFKRSMTHATRMSPEGILRGFRFVKSNGLAFWLVGCPYVPGTM